MTASNCWADGYYVGYTSSGVTMCNVLATNNRRHGMAITSVSGMLVNDSTFENSTGFLENGALANGFGIDVEPNAGQTVTGLTIANSTFTNDAGTGISLGSNGPTQIVTNILLDNNTISGCGTLATLATRGIWTVGATNCELIKNKVQSNNGVGIQLVNAVANTLVT